MKKVFLKSKAAAWILVAALMISLLSTASFALDNEYEADDAVSFVFSDSAISTEDTAHTSAYKISGTALTIKSAGTYILSGTCADGSVTVKKGTTDVTLVLNGLSLTNTGTATSSTAPLTCNKSTGVTIVAAAGTVNTLADSIYNNDETYPSNEDAENAVIKCKDGSQVILTGTGTLNITANGKNCIKSGTTDTETDASNPRDAYLTIQNLVLNMTANVNDAINAEQELNILSGNLNIAAADDAIHSDYNLTIGADGTTGPTINITTCYEGIEGATISICSGNISMLCTDDCINAANADLSSYSFSLSISGGKIYAYTTTGDGFDSNGTMAISGGEVEVWSANNSDNQPLDADSTIYLTGGTVFAAGGSNGMGTKLSATQAYTIFGASGGQRQPGIRGGSQRPGQQPDSQTTSIEAGNYVNVTSSSGTVVYTTTAPCKTTYILFSSPSLSSSDTYSLASGTAEHSHTWNAGAVTTAATCNTDGIMTYTCTACGAVRTETIPATGLHTWDSGIVTTAATATTDGVKTYTCTVCGESYMEVIPAIGGSSSPFEDVNDSSEYYYDPVLWAADNGIVYGIDATHFAPLNSCTRAQVVTILYRLAGEPSVTGTNPFTDVSEDAYYYDAVLWGYQENIVYGTAEDQFSPDVTVSRAQFITFLYRYAGEPEVTNTACCFADLAENQYYYDAVLWGYQNEIVYGTDETHFSPDGTCTRAQVVTFIYRFQA